MRSIGPQWLHFVALAAGLIWPAAVWGQLLEEFAGGPPAEVQVSDDGVVTPAAYQPPALNQPVQPARSPAPSRSLASRQRLASVPNMFGDIGMTAGSVVFIDRELQQGGAFSIPGAGGSRRVKIGENNSPIPQDRMFAMYNHFHNAYQFTEGIFSAGPVTRQEPIDRFTFGVEKTFLDEWWSVELRVPVVSDLDVEGESFAARGGSWGNLAVIVKRLLYEGEFVALAAGLGLDIPTGSDFESRVGSGILKFENDSLHLLPYLGAVVDPGGGLFFTGYVQVDVAANGNDVFAGVPGQTRQVGIYNEQNLMYFDLGAGYWIYDNPYAEWVTGIAAMLEFHHTTAIQDTDLLVVQGLTTTAMISNTTNRFDVTNVSTGLNFELGGWSNLRVAGVFPLGDSFERRFFDAEVQVQYNQRF
jgi:hypothetical protein